MDFVKVSTQKLPESQVLLEIEIDPDQMEKSMDKAYRKLVQKVEVPGFRKGKTPRNMLERHIGRGRLLEEAMDIVIPEAYNQALEENDIDAIDQPKIELVSAEPLSFKATVPIRPAVDLGDYLSIRVPRDPVVVDESEVEEALLEMRRRYAVHEPVERPVEKGDIIRGDVRIVVEDKDVYTDEDIELTLREGKTVLLPGFAEGIVGAKKGETKEVEVTLPDDAESSLAGKQATVHFSLKEVKEERLPEPDDEFAKEVGEGFDSIDALVGRLRGDIRERLESQVEGAYQEAVLGALAENAKSIEFPQVLVDREIDRFLQDQARNTGMELDRYLELIKKSTEEVREDLAPSATERVRRTLALSQVADEEKLEVTDADIDAEIEKLISQAAGANQEQLDQYRKIFQSPEARRSLSSSVLTRKTMDRLVEIASQEDGAKPKAKSSSKPQSKKKADEPEAAESTEEAS